MFQLEERQLHSLIGLLCGASMLLFCIFGIGKIPKGRELAAISGMEDFSDAWVCTYETEDADKLKESHNRDGDKTVTEVVDFPSAFKVEKGKKITLTHKVPDLDMETMYLTFETNNQKVQVFVEQDMVYSSAKSEQKLSAFHIVPIGPQYRNMVVTIELTGQSGNRIEMKGVQAGTYGELITQAFRENGLLFIMGLLFLVIGICMSAAGLLAHGSWKQKKPLLYCCMEGFCLGLLFLAESHVVRAVMNWNYGIYFIKSCLIVIASVLHLMLVRCLLSRKKMLFFVDTGILVYGIFYISIMVMQALSLLQFDTAYLLGKILYGIGIVLYAFILWVAVYGYKQKEERTVFIANAVLACCLVLQTVLRFSKIGRSFSNVFVPLGFLLYMAVVWMYGLRDAIYARDKEAVDYDEEAVRAQVVEQLNPNLLFASFHTLQNLIKNGSGQSVKMIYYISVYIRDNLKALEQRGELVPFEEELEHMIAYLQLQKTRNQNLDFSIECKEMEFKVPRHSIEPMVENAVKYGIANQNNTGNIVIRTYQREDGYGIQVIDDGAGFDKSVLTRNSPTALLNLFTLLEKACGAKPKVVSKEGKGTVITIVLPVQEEEAVF